MKLRLPHSLLLFLLSLTVTLPAFSGSVISSGVAYDVSKASPQYSGSTTSTVKDTLYCWAASSSNVIQAWQDKYLNSDNTASSDVVVPNGITSTAYDGTNAVGVNKGKSVGDDTGAPGTAYLEVYQTFLDYGTKDAAGSAGEAFDWWFKNKASEEGHVMTKSRESEYAYYNIYEGMASVGYSRSSESKGMECFKETDLKEMMKDGQPIVLTIHQAASTVPFRDEWGVYHYAGDARSHAITCWGYETDAEGHVSALFLSDSDDLSYGVFKAQAAYKEEFDSTYHQYMDVDMWETLHIYTDDKHDGYNGDFEVGINKAEAMNSLPAGSLELNAGASLSPENGIADTGRVEKNTVLSGVAKLDGKGVTVGTDNSIVMLTTGTEGGLKMDGQSQSVSALTVKTGSLASLESVDVEHYKEGAMVLEGRGYLHDGQTKIANNEAENGAAVKTSVYLEIEGNGSVEITGNNAKKNGGGIYNTGTVSIFGNTSVEFSGNTASQEGGQDIYNAETGVVNIYNNQSVVFASNGNGASVRNEGELYIAAEEGHDVKFKASSLDSRNGVAYVGKDLNGNAINTTGGVTFTDEDETNTMSIYAASAPVQPNTPVYKEVEDAWSETGTAMHCTGYETRVPATLKNVQVSLSEINGVSAAESVMTGAQVKSTAALTVKNLTLDKTSSLTAGSTLTLDKVVFDLTDVAMTSETLGQGRLYTFDLTGYFNASAVTLTDMIFDTTVLMPSLSLSESDAVVIKMGELDQTGKAYIRDADGLRAQVSMTDGAVRFSMDSPLVVIPEPATSALSLLALAGLAARRRRR